MNYENAHELMERSSILIDDIFAYTVAHEIIEHDDIEPCSVEECQLRADWPKWKEAIQAELDSLAKRQVLGPVVLTPPSVKPVGHKWVFVRKRNENNEVIRYKARLVAQGFSQRPGIDYEETYSLLDPHRCDPQVSYNIGCEITVVYVDDMNIIGTLDEIRDTTSYLKSEFEMKDLGKTRYCLGIELEHRACGILIHQSAYIQKLLR
ncbi:hypothetical protein OSB04_023890 [Centaurea solstitialis]|uniref:Reverse transcriptase Ty1/copia-type domain-containing protein n=1 Tax=Centaurea solstitialis TaxID=347529 RepID=A0AA38SKR0_9ASTR|nr:hypothetical protein OSB04_023890 [Centaurea solstitialis]